MTRENQIFVDEARGVYYCMPCQRYFRSGKGAISHASTAAIHHGEWCDRCEWLFVSEEALDSHVDNSRFHCVCDVCNQDVGDCDDLDHHIRSSHDYCRDCGKGFGNRYDLFHVRIPLPHRRLDADRPC